MDLRWKRTVRLTMVLSLLVQIAVACGGPSGTTTGPSYRSGGTLTMRLNGDWTSSSGAPWDIGSFPSTNAQFISQLFYDRLVAVGPKNTVAPYLAKSWTITPATIVFTLRKDAVCQDGTPITPTVVAKSLHRFTDPGTKSSQAARLLTAGPFTITPDDAAATVTFTTAIPSNELIWGFTNPQTGIICPAGISNPTTMKSKPAGSGPYTLETNNQGDSLTAALRPDWSWGPQGVTSKTAGLPAKVTFKLVASETTAANLLTTGGVDMALITSNDVVRLLADPSLSHKDAHSFYAFPLVVNQAAGHPGADPVLREALFQAIDPKGYNQVANGGRGILSSSFLTPDANCYDASTKPLAPTYNVDKAKATLTAGGYSVGSGGITKDGKPVNLMVVGRTDFNQGPDYLISQLNNLGFKTDGSRPTLDNVPYGQAFQAGNWDITVEFIPTATPEPGVNITFFTGEPPPKGTNFARMLDSKITGEVQAALQAPLADRCKQWATVQEDLLKNHDLLPTAAPLSTWFGKKVDFQPATTFIEPYTLRVLS